jgi:hypothetical protein
MPLSYKCMNQYNSTLPKFTAETALIFKRAGDSRIYNLVDYISVPINFRMISDKVTLAQQCPPCTRCSLSTNTRTCYEWDSESRRCIRYTDSCPGTPTLNCCGRPSGSACP